MLDRYGLGPASRFAQDISPAFTLRCGHLHGRIAPERTVEIGLRMTDQLRTIKKYPNRRLYDTMNSGYITLADVKKMILEKIEFKVVDAKSNEDLTRTILLQIILEEESGGMPMFSSEMLTQMIRFYGHAMQGVMGTYLERNLQSFLQIQNKLQEQTKNLYGDASSLTPEVWKQFLQMQAPGMQGMIGNYLEQSAKAFMEMQAQMQKQARGMFGAFQFPGFPPSGANNEDK
jgi:polyhydroxyalkanoate synthesis repressor PhaR